jgi:hypothetical protein
MAARTPVIALLDFCSSVCAAVTCVCLVVFGVGVAAGFGVIALGVEMLIVFAYGFALVSVALAVGTVVVALISCLVVPCVTAAPLSTPELLV